MADYGNELRRLTQGGEAQRQRNIKDTEARNRRRERRQERQQPKGGPGPGALGSVNAANDIGGAIANAFTQPRSYPAGGPGSGPGGAALAAANAMSFDQAIRNAFGIAPKTTPPTQNMWGAPNANRNYNLPLVRLTSGYGATSPGYQATWPGPAGESKTVTERYQDWINSVPNSALGYESYLFPTTSTDTGASGGGGFSGGGGGYGGGGGGYGGGNATSAAYSAWLRGLLTRWNI